MFYSIILTDILCFWVKHGVAGGDVSLFVLHLLFFVITFIEEPCGLCRSRWCEMLLLFSLIPFDYVWFFLFKKHVVYVGGEVMLFCRILVVFVLFFIEEPCGSMWCGVVDVLSANWYNLRLLVNIFHTQHSIINIHQIDHHHMEIVASIQPPNNQ